MGQRMQSKYLLMGAAIATVLATASPCAVAQSAVERQLIEQGRYWLQQRDADISLILGINVGFKNTKPHIPSSNTMDVINSFFHRTQ